MKGTLLIVDDSDVDRENLRRMLAFGAAIDMEIIEAENAEQALGAISNGVSCVLLDFRMPGINGVEFLRMAPGTEDIAVIVLTGETDEDVATESLKSGAQDFLRKDQLDAEMLVSAIDSACATVRIQKQERNQQRQLKLFRELVDQIDDLLLIIDMDDEKVIEANQSARFTLGLEAGQIEDKRVTVSRAFPQKPRLWSEIKVHSDFNRYVRLETTLDTGENRITPVELFARRVTISLHEYIVIQIRDVSHFKRSERELIRMRDLDEETDLGGPTALNEVLQQFQAQLRRDSGELGVLIIGFDGLEQLHEKVPASEFRITIRQIADQLSEHMQRYNEFLVRYDKFRFAVALRATDQAAAELIAIKLRNRVADLDLEHPDSSRPCITAVIGGSSRLLSHLGSINSLIDTAEAAQTEAREHAVDGLLFR